MGEIKGMARGAGRIEVVRWRLDPEGLADGMDVVRWRDPEGVGWRGPGRLAGVFQTPST